MRIAALMLTLALSSTALFAQNEISLQTKAATQGTPGVQLFVGLSHDIPTPGLAGFSFGLQHDVAALDLVDFEYFLALVDPDFIQVSVPAPGTAFPTIGVIFALTPPLEYLSTGSYTIARVTYDVLPTAPTGPSDVSFAPVGSPPVETLFADAAGNNFPPDVITDGGIVVLGPIPIGSVENQLVFPNGGDQTVSIVDSNGAVLATGSGAPEEGPSAVAIGPNGVGWVCFADTGTVVRFLPDGTVIGNPIPVGTTATSVCIDLGGNAWVTDASEGTVTKVSPSGLVLLGNNGALGPAIDVGAGPQGVASDALGNIWVAVSGDAQLKKLNNVGDLAAVVDLPSGSEPFGVAIDRSGVVWLTLRGSNVVQRRSSDGSLIEAFPPLPVGADPEGIAIRGEDEAWVAAELPYRFVSGSVPDPIDDPGTPDPTGVAVDGTGRIWVTAADGTAYRFDADGTPAAFNPVIIGAMPRFTGDASGLVQASLLRPTQDFDGDGFPNLFELDSGTNPFDDADVPIDVPTVTELQCTIVGQDVILSWTNPPLTYDSIEVRRFDSGGGFIDLPSLPGDTVTITDSGVPLDSYVYEVTGVLSGAASAAVACAVIVGQGGLQGTNPIGADIGERATNLFDVASTRASTGPSFYATDSAAGVIYALDPEYRVIAVFDSPFQGAVPSTGIAFDPDGDGGSGSLFIASGGDAMSPAQIAETTRTGTVIPTSAGGLGVLELRAAGSIPVLGSLGGMSFDPDASRLYLVGPTGCEIYGLLVTTAMPEIDLEIENPTGPAGGLNGVEFIGDATGTVADFSLLVTSSEGTSDPPQYSVSLIDVTGTTAVEVASLPLSTLETSENVFGGFTLLDSSLSIVGSTTSVVYEVLTTRPFVRGDANGDGSVEISDAIAVLSAVFVGASFFNCPLGFDANDDGAVQISDGVYLLSFLFTPGAPPPPPPFPDFGLSPTPTALLCF